MKKIILTCLCAILLLLSGCSTRGHTNDASFDGTTLIPVGTYIDVSFNDTNTLFTDFKLQSAGRENKKETIVVTAADVGYSYRDSLHSGHLTDNGDGSFTAKKEKVITDDPYQLKFAELVLEKNPYATYTVYENYLIEKVPLGVENITGELPAGGKKTSCFIRIEHLTFSTYTLKLSTDGSCEIMTVFNGDVNTCSGTYSVNGKIISLTFTEGVLYEEKVSGNVEMALYIEGSTLYDIVYRKK